MRPLHRTRAVLTAAASTAVVTLAMGTPAQAASTGWQVVFTHHYGKATDYSEFTATAAISANDAWAFGITGRPGAPQTGTPVALSWNGTTWTRSTLPSGPGSAVNGVSAVSASSIYATTEVGGYILHWNGSQWSVAEQIPGASDLALTGVTALSDSDVWAFGATGFGPGTGTWHFDGHTWTHVTGTVASGLSNASAVSPTDIWAVATSPTGGAGSALAHYNGTSWQIATAKALTGLEFGSIVAPSANDVWATSYLKAGHPDEQLLHFNGTAWTVVPSAYPKLQIDSAAPDGQGGFWFTAGNISTDTDWVVHYSATGQWSRTEIASYGMTALALTPGTTSLWGVGSVATKTASNARIWSYTPAS